MKIQSKRITAVLLALLTALCLTVSAFADYQVTVELDKDKKTITITNTDTDTYKYVIFPQSTDLVTGRTEDGQSIMYSQLTPGTEYTISAFIKDDNDDPADDIIVSSTKVKLLKTQNPPVAPTVISATATEVVVKYMTGCEISIDNINYVQFKNNSNYTFTGLTPETQYVVYARKIATETHYASAPMSSEVRTLKVGDKTIPAEAVLEDITNTSITVRMLAGYEYSLDKETWQATSEFKGLKANTVYTVYQRLIFDSTVYEPSICSKGVQFQTTSRAPMKANPDSAEVVIPSGKHAAVKMTITAKTYFPAKDVSLVYGDSKLTPAYVWSDKDTTPVEFNATEKDKNTYEASFTPSADGSYNFYVVFKQQKYDGKGNWVDEGIVTRTIAVKILAKQNTFEKIVEFMGNLLLNDIPSALAKAGSWLGNVINWIVKILGKLN